MFKNFIKTIFLLIISFSLLISLNNTSKNSIASAHSTISKGADIGWISQLQDNGISWVNESGVTENPLKILKDQGIDSVRLRVFVNPPTNAQWTKNDGTTCLLGYADKDSVVEMAKQASDLGLKIMIDFHYSDHFADPAYQDIPEEWSGHSLEQLQEDVYNHTYEVMTSLADAGIYPEWVQAGNETNSGMLWPYGYIWNGNSTPDVTNWVSFINKGYEAVKKVSPSSKVIIHLAEGHENELFRNIFDALTAEGAKYDVIGMSYYPYWAGVDYKDSIEELSYNLQDMASRYNKEVMVCEVGGLENDETESYNLIKAVMNAVMKVPNGKGLGVFYWEPAATSSVLPDEYPLGACKEISTNVLKFTTALDAFKAINSSFPNTNATYKIVNRLSGKALNVSGGAYDNGATIEQYTYYDWDSQKWILIPVGDNYYKIQNVGSGKVLDISSSSLHDGASCIQWQDNNGYNQQWKFNSTWDSYFTLENRNSSKILGLQYDSREESILAVQTNNTEAWSHMWLLIEVN
ncbi:glycosyl hydrolase 53 family protein [uncultured Clostridium sp.]|uniref:glycosyl hydrolase 53 family protein n=1 Tax=uncultured Clostridium sp. TaxID=59620 RepID=UPI0026216EB7|nr:glycosyl hydrolase 53 family protein [uncultured Clostridium sp.]